MREIAMPTSNTLELIFIGITAVAVLMQAFLLLGIYLTVVKAVQSMNEKVGELKDDAAAFRSTITPVMNEAKELMVTARDVVATVKTVMASTRTLIEELEPRLESAATDLADIARDIHVQANQLQASVDEVARKARRQADRVDGMATSVLNGLERFGSFVNQTVSVPVRQVSGVVAAAKAVVETLRSPSPPSRVRQAGHATGEPTTDDRDMFV